MHTTTIKKVHKTALNIFLALLLITPFTAIQAQQTTLQQNQTKIQQLHKEQQLFKEFKIKKQY